MSDILFLVEHDKGQLKNYSLELASKANELASQLGSKVHAVVVGAEANESVAALGDYGVAQVFVLQGATLKAYRGEVVTQGLLQVIQSLNPKVILASASGIGKDLLPRVAMKIKAGLATDCVELSIQNGKLVAKRPIFAGKALTTVEFLSDVQLATARPNSFMTKKGTASKPHISAIEVTADEPRVKVKEIKQAEVGMKDLTEAEIIVSGGRALGSGENFKYIRELADALGASVGASRAAVDAGYISHDHQVGQTGKTVNPKLYIACGISGAIQHLAGMRTSKVIVAINKDAEAPIFSKADYGIVGDLFTLLPLLTKKFKELLGK